MIVIIAAMLSMASADPPIPNWGGNISAKYWEGYVHMTDPADEPAHPTWYFNYYYDSTGSIAVDRYDHQPGGSDELCVYCGGTHYQPGSACTVINAADGVYVQYDNATSPRKDGSASVHDLAPSAVGCCDCSAKVKANFGTTNLAIRSDFLRANNPTYLGQGEINGRKVDGWLVYGNDANHYWVTSDV